MVNDGPKSGNPQLAVCHKIKGANSVKACPGYHGRERIHSTPELCVGCNVEDMLAILNRFSFEELSLDQGREAG